MFRGLSTTPSDIFPIPIPIWKTPYSGSVPLADEHREFAYDKIEAIITTYTQNVNYSKFINWNNVYLAKFPTNFAAVPAIIYSSTYGEGMCINEDVGLIKFDKNKNRVQVNEPVSFATCLLYGISKLILQEMNNEQYLHEFYKAICVFLYVIFIRSYQRDFDIRSFQDQELGTIFFLLSKLASYIYLSVDGNINAVAKAVTLDFFVKGQKYSSLRIDPSEFPDGVDVSSFGDFLTYMDRSKIMTGITLEDFRTRIIRGFSMPALIGMSTGLELVSMLISSKIASQVFSNRISGISPGSVSVISKVMQKYTSELLESQNKTDEDSFYLDREW